MKEYILLIAVFSALGIVVLVRYYPLTRKFFMKSWEKAGKPRNCNWCRYKRIEEDYYEGWSWYCCQFWDSGFRRECVKFRVGKPVEMGGEGDF
jgi:hypothetical protein